MTIQPRIAGQAATSFSLDTEFVRLRVVSWNVLADEYIRPEWFPRTPLGLLAPAGRMFATLHWLAGFDAEIIALQEATAALAQEARLRLPEWDVRWCPKTHQRPDGCLTLVRPGQWRIAAERQISYQDGNPASGHVAHILEVSGPRNAHCTVVNTHIRHESRSGVASADHVGVRQAHQLISALTAIDQSVLAADLNDQPEGPVRAALVASGLVGCDDASPTSIFNGDELRALDVVASGKRLMRLNAGPVLKPRAPMPGPDLPSDHVPIRAELNVPCN